MEYTKYTNWQQKITTLLQKNADEDEETKKNREYLKKVTQRLEHFFCLLQNTDLQKLQKYNNDNYCKVCQQLSLLEQLFDNNCDIDKEQFRELNHLAITSYRFLAAARRELLPFMLIILQDEVEKEKERVVKKEKFMEQAQQQILLLVGYFENTDIDKLELYAPQIWKEIRHDLSAIENMITKPSEELSVLNTIIAKLIEKLQRANTISKTKQQEISDHLDATQLKLNELITKIASLKFPQLVTHRFQQCSDLLGDLEKVNTSFFYNESSSALDYRAANARMDDSLRLISLSIPVLEEEIAKQQQDLLAKKEALQNKSVKDQTNCRTTIKLLTKTRLIAIGICVPFLLLASLIISAYSFFTDVFFMAPFCSVKEIVTFHGISSSHLLFSGILLFLVLLTLFVLLKKISPSPYSLKKIQQHSIFTSFVEQNGSIAVIAIKMLSVILVFVAGFTLLLAPKINNLRLENIQNFSHRDFDDIINHIHILEKYRNHPQPDIQNATSQTLFTIYSNYKNDPKMEQYRAQYQQNLIAQQQWQKLSQILPASEFAQILTINIDTQNLDDYKALFSILDKNILQHLLPLKPREVAVLSMENLTQLEPVQAKHWEAVFSFYHDEEKKQRQAIEYLLRNEKSIWLDEMLKLAEINKDVETQNLLIKGIVKLAANNKDKAQTILASLIALSQNHKGMRFQEITIYGIAKMMHPSSLDYLRNHLPTVTSEHIQIQIIHTLMEMEDKQAASEMVTVLCESEHYKVCKKAAYALNKLVPQHGKVWKKMASIKSVTSRKKAIVQYSGRYKIIIAGKYLRKLTTQKSPLASQAKKAIRAILLHQRKQTTIVLMDLFSDREQTVKKILQKQGFHNIILVPNLETIPYADIVIATENSALSQERITQLLAKGTEVLLLYNSAKVLGGEWHEGNTENHRTLHTKTGFLGDFQKELLLQSQENTPFIHSSYPDNWKPYPGNESGSTILYQTNNNQILGIIFTYDPQYFTRSGSEMFVVIVDFLLRIERF